MTSFQFTPIFTISALLVAVVISQDAQSATHYAPSQTKELQQTQYTGHVTKQQQQAQATVTPLAYYGQASDAEKLKSDAELFDASKSQFGDFREPEDFGIFDGDYYDSNGNKRYAPRFLGKRFSRFIGKRFGEENEEEEEEEKRSAPRFLGKRYSPRFVGKRYAPRFLGKRGAPRFIGKRVAPRFIGKRVAPRFVGKRLAPRFIGKKRAAELMNEDVSGSRPHYIKKRSIWFSVPDAAFDLDKLKEAILKDALEQQPREYSASEWQWEEKRDAPRFVGKRSNAPRFVGKRGAPRFVGKRYYSDNALPNLLRSIELPENKRGAPRFVGKKSMFNSYGSNKLKERDIQSFLDQWSRQQALKQLIENDKRWSTPVTPGFIGKRMASEISGYKR